MHWFISLISLIFVATSIGCTEKQFEAGPSAPTSNTIAPKNYGAIAELMALTHKAKRAAEKREHSGLVSTCNRAVPCSADAAGIQKAMLSSMHHFNDCLLAWHTLNQDALSPQVQFELSPTGHTPARGHITQIKITTPGLGNPFLRGCLLAGLSELYFSALPGSELTLTATLPAPKAHAHPPDH